MCTRVSCVHVHVWLHVRVCAHTCMPCTCECIACVGMHVQCAPRVHVCKHVHVSTHYARKSCTCMSECALCEHACESARAPLCACVSLHWCEHVCACACTCVCTHLLHSEPCPGKLLGHLGSRWPLSTKDRLVAPVPSVWERLEDTGRVLAWAGTSGR